MVIIRNETEADYKTVEEITRKAFYNLYMEGCMEHYLIHIMRRHEDFIPALDFVIELDGQVIGNIMYTKSKLTDESGTEKETLTFGPICVLPGFQRRGYGKKLMAHSFGQAKKMGYDTIVIFGSPVMAVNMEDAISFDDALVKMEKKHQASQEEFYIMSRSFLE